jgi:hypothetical protein
VAFGGGVNLCRARPWYRELLNERKNFGNNGASTAHHRHLGWALSRNAAHMLLLIAVAARAALRAEANRSGGGGKARLNL